MIFFTADLHLGHENVIKHCARPYEDAAEMDAALICNWNGTVRPSDEVYILGDFTMKPAAAAHEYLSALKGRKYMIRGNHDVFLKKFEPYAGDFVWVKDYHVLRYDGRKIILFHYPIAEWDGFFRDAIHLYGHVHNNGGFDERYGSAPAFNVGVDICGYRPISVEEIIAKADAVTHGGEAQGNQLE